MKILEIKNGILYRDNKAMVFISADYPYYRDKVINWSDRLEKIKGAGIDTVTFYIPWRHHHLRMEGGEIIDFTGETQANRNVIKFIEFIKAKGMYCIVKPGPLIHAETNFGGLPDFVEGEKYEEAQLDARGKPRRWFGRKVLPAPFSPSFSNKVKEWLARVTDTIIKPYSYPGGPIIGIQLLNEGLYSSGQLSALDYDFSPSGIEFHRRRLKDIYGNIEEYNNLFDTAYKSFNEIPIPRECDLTRLKEKKELIPYLHWAETQSYYLEAIYQEWGKELIKRDLPVLNNLNPPLDENKGFDYWLTRVVPENWSVNYGFTNWIGVVSHDETAFLRYLLLVKRGRGINLEENWGFSKLYDHRYKYHHIPFYQTLLAMGLGATGFNVYTGVATAHWDDGLDSHHEIPYPATPPISEKGETNSKYDVLKILTSYLKENQEILLEGKRSPEASWGLYLPYSYLVQFGLENKDYSQLKIRAPRSGFKGLDSFMLSMLDQQREFGIVNIGAASLGELSQQKVLVILGGFFMDQVVQEKLINYVRNGGNLFYFGEIPHLDANLKPYSRLADFIGDNEGYFRREEGQGVLVYYPSNPFNSGGISPTFINLLEDELDKPLIQAEKAYVFYYQKDQKELVYILSNSQQAESHSININGRELKVNLPAKGCAIVTLEGEEIVSCLIKGINDYDRSYVTPSVSWGKDKIEAGGPSDFYYSKRLRRKMMVNRLIQ